MISACPWKKRLKNIRHKTEVWKFEATYYKKYFIYLIWEQKLHGFQLYFRLQNEEMKEK